MTESRHPHDALQEALDGRLDEAARAELDRHLAKCDACRAELEALRWTKTQVATRRSERTVPPEFESVLQRVLEAEPQTSTSPESHRSTASWWADFSLRRWIVPAAGLATAILLITWVWPRLTESNIPAQVATDFRAYRTGTLSLGVRTSDVAEIEQWFRRAGVTFPTRVFDFGLMDFMAVGGQVHQLDGQPSALFAYRGPGDQDLICQMYEGRIDELPTPERRLSHEGIDFLVYEREGLTLVFWQERNLDVVCVLVGEGDAQLVIDFAFAKATEL